MRKIALGVVLMVVTAAAACAPAALDSAQAQALLNEKYPGGTVDVIGVRHESADEAIAKVSLGGVVEVDVVFRRYDTGWIADGARVMGREISLSDAAGLGAPIQQLMAMAHRGRQRSTMADMRDLAAANGAMRVDSGRYAVSLRDLEGKGYIDVAPTEDGWGNVWIYTVSADTYTLMSRGSDGAAGPPPPVEWFDEPYDPDIILTDGRFAQAPMGR